MDACLVADAVVGCAYLWFGLVAKDVTEFGCANLEHDIGGLISL